MVKGSIEAVVADKEVVEPQKEMVGDPFVQKKFFVPHDSCNAENRVSTAEWSCAVFPVHFVMALQIFIIW